MKKSYFIAGTNTGVGKTQIAAGILFAAKEQGLSSIALKPIASGCEESEAGLRNEDALILQQQATVKLDYQQVNPVALKLAVAPHIAAAQEGRKLSLERLEGFCRGAMMSKHELCLVEGAGGWRVPLNEAENLSGLPKRLNLPVILVVGMHLGCLNHALLTAEAIVKDGVQIAGWVANSIQREMPFEPENIGTLRFRLPFPFLGHVPYLEDPSPEKISQFIDVKNILT